LLPTYRIPTSERRNFDPPIDKRGGNSGSGGGPNDWVSASSVSVFYPVVLTVFIGAMGLFGPIAPHTRQRVRGMHGLKGLQHWGAGSPLDFNKSFVAR